MELLKKYVKLSSRVALYVPGTFDINKISNNAAWVSTVSKSFSQMFGGATVTAAAGYWEDIQAGMISENVTIVYAYTDTETLKTEIHKVLQLAKTMKDELKQTAISLEVNGSLYFI